jgi:hypothetical protein
MAVRGDEVAGSIEAHVRDAMEKLVGEIRSSIEDVREVVDSQLKAALQSVQADVNAVSFLPHIQKSIGELEESITSAIPPPPPPQKGADASRVKQAVQAVERGRSQVDILNALLDQCLTFGSRAAMLILRGETFSGWKGAGFTAAGGNDEQIKRFNAAPGLIPELDRVLRDEQVVTWDGANLSTRLGVPASTTAILVPMVIKDKIAAAVYVDAVEADAAKLDAASLELLVFTTGLLIDTVASRKKTPSPSLNDGESVTAPQAKTAPEPAPAPAPRATPPSPPARPSPPVADESSDTTVAVSAAQLREMMAPTAVKPAFTMPPETDFAAPSTAMPSAASFMTTALPAIEAPPPAPPPPPAAPAHEREERASTQYIPPANLTTRGGAPIGGAIPADDSKRHDEARRFARLLVSEIKLYNEPKVDLGRRNKDLYERLKEDIDRSRQMYDERIAEDVRKSSNYFYDELVRILADGDATALGL